MDPSTSSVRVEPPAHAPAGTGEGPRIGDLDALRGFALLGILVVNIAFFASGYPFHLVPDPSYDSWLDQVTRWLVELLFTMKFYLLFSFLFGYSFTLQIDSAVRRGVAFAPRFRRRLAGLFVLGVLHAVLLFHGDILTTYALLGLVLLAARGLRPRTASTLAGALLGLVALVIALAAVRGGGLVPDPTIAADAGARSTEALRGGLGSVLVEHLRAMPAMISALLVQGPLALCAFLVGLAAGRVRLLADVTPHRLLLRRVQWVGYPVGLAGALVFAVGGGTANLTGLVLSIVTAPLLMAAYVATALRAFHTGRGPRLAAVLAPAGRMALSNYLGQSVAGVLIFTGVGFGLVGRVAPLPTLLIAVAIYGGQLAFSAWWLARFRYGPVEWLLRSWTDARRVPLRR
ncbi:DUF418 domain-containing protein [Micromonospora sp. NBC_01699]|uniref:DUF418 domain-containing protein n=1 Tax=Micromonospora sp. NBC_01699 TaxID=2975984 RepID=UPI002E2ED67E|nr:DUF418 domain-containing protein [Micromonospora sp. NBC_01699]